LKCSQGVVLVTDSLTPCGDGNGRWSWVVDGKLRWLAGTDTACVITGHSNDGLEHANGVMRYYSPLPPGLPQEPDPRDRVRRAYQRIREIDAEVRSHMPQNGDHDYSDMPDPGPHALFAVHRRGQEPRLARFTSLTEIWGDVGAVLTIGSWVDELSAELAAEMRRASDTLAGCRDAAASWVRRFLAPMSDEDQAMLGIGFPLHVVTMSDESIDQEAIAE
jgi:hypothetical protein